MFQAILSTIGHLPAKLYTVGDIVVTERSETRLRRGDVECLFQKDLEALTRRPLISSRETVAPARPLARAC